MKRQGFATGGLAGLTPSAGLAAPTIPGIPFVAYRSADATGRTNNTLANDDATGGTLQFPITASATAAYGVVAWLIFNAANIAMDVKVGWNATGLPAGATALWGASAGLNSVGPAPLAGFTSRDAAGAPPALLAIGGTASYGSPAGTFGVGLAGTFFGGGAAGNIVFAWAQNTTDAGALVLKAGSWLSATLLRA